MTVPNERTHMDIADLATALQKSLSCRIAVVAEHLAELRSAAGNLFNERRYDGILPALEDANRLYNENTFSSVLSSCLPPNDVETLAILAQPPGFSKPLWHPKRWVAEMLRLLGKRQYQFNQRAITVLMTLAESVNKNSQSLLDNQNLLWRLSAQLLCAANAQLHHLIEQERELCQWLILLLDKCECLFPAVYPAAGGESNEDNTSRPSLSDTSSTQPLSSLRSLLETYETHLERIEEVSREVAGLRENWLVGQRLLTDFKQEVSEKLAQLDAEISALSSLLAKSRFEHEAEKPTIPTGEPTSGASLPTGETFSFLEFERALRGGEMQILEEQSKYVEFFRGCEPVLDIGCGRGEFLELLQEHGVRGFGIDADETMVAYCKQKKLAVEKAGLEDYLPSLPPESLGGVFMGQVIEHLPQDQVLSLPRILWEKLKPGGAVVIETVNPMCLSTFSGAMYADPTHVRPIHPKGLEFLFTSVGFIDTSILLSAPIPEEDKLALLQEKGPLDPVAKDLVLQANKNFEKLNSLLYSYANYAFVARKPR